MLTPSQLLDKKPSNKELRLVLKSEKLFGSESPTLILKVPPVQARQKAQQRAFQFSTSDNGGMSFNFYAYSMTMIEYVTDWEWGDEPFSRETLKKLFDEYEEMSSSFAPALLKIFQDLENQRQDEKKS